MEKRETITIKTDKGIIRIHPPTITEEERELRMKIIEKAALDILSKGD